MSGNACSLIVNAVLFFAITAAQFVASLPMYANSLALRADCLSMFVDGMTYLGNLGAECTVDKQRKALLEVVVSGLSLLVLFAFTLYFIVDAAVLISAEDEGKEGDDDVGFGGGGGSRARPSYTSTCFPTRSSPGACVSHTRTHLALLAHPSPRARVPHTSTSRLLDRPPPRSLVRASFCACVLRVLAHSPSTCLALLDRSS